MANRTLILLLILFGSCRSITYYEKKAIRTHDRELYNMVDSYYETIDNPWNNRPGEQDSIMDLIKSKRHGL
jgi:hypothetical protein